MRDRFLRAVVLFGVCLVAITEFLSALSLLRGGPVLICWIAALLIAVVIARRHPFTIRLDPLVVFCTLSIALILAVTALTAAFSPPNSADAMAYHLPRVIYWAEQSSVRFFPTPYFNQVMLQPMAEYLMLHTYLLTGGDHLSNLGTWFASLAAIIGVSSVAGALGADSRGQAFAALFCAILPAGILASSGAKNDYWLAVWLVASAYFALCFTRSLRRPDALFLGAAIGLALLTKATAYLFLPWPLAAIFVVRKGRVAAGALAAAAVAFALNAPQYARNYGLSGSVLGFDSAQGNGLFPWRNETLGWRPAASNVLRNLSDQLGARSTAWNQRVYRLVVDAHRALGIDPDDPGATWRGSTFTGPTNANHEANAPNRWHLAILFAIACALAVQALRRRDREQSLYILALVCAFLAFCAYLKWQPFQARLLLPLFVLSAPLAAVIRRWPLQLALALFLLSAARLPLLENWVRPLRGPHSVLHTPRDEQYFADMTQWNNQASYWKAVDVLAASKCNTVGIDITNLQLEYPLQALLRERNPSVRFLHTGVQNVSVRYAPPVSDPPCAIACLDCAGDSTRLALYANFPTSIPIDKFVIFLR